MTNNYYQFYLFLFLYIPGAFIMLVMVRICVDFILRKFILKPFRKKIVKR
jgi:hypothetical protein